MFLLFFLLVAAGMLSLLWLWFPMQGGLPPADPLPPRQQVTTPGAAAPEAAAPTASTPGPSSEATEVAAAAGGADAATAATAADATPRAPAAMDVPAGIGAAPSGSGRTTDAQAGTPAAPALPTIEELDRQLDKLLGLPPASPTRP
jgi:hypothetical protein